MALVHCANSGSTAILVLDFSPQPFGSVGAKSKPILVQHVEHVSGSLCTNFDLVFYPFSSRVAAYFAAVMTSVRVTVDLVRDG